MLKTGITGGIGSGKSLICKFFETLGIPVFYADREARRVAETVARPRLIALFGNEAFLPDRRLNSRKIADAVFQAPELLAMLNKILHPEVKRQFLQWADEQEAPYVLHEAAILFESGFNEVMDCNILVTAPEELRISRVMQRDGISREEVLRRIENQWPDEQKSELADFVIRNDERHLLIPELLELHNTLTTWKN
ncbi:MAG: dephospho-CoA kinase [Bacteroidales bacterium]|jgi:dephospho-CoA kinase|nr:dephospho-CoA kinase [Bacteroidales bacterium]